ncbi:MAG: TfuA-related McrA-glycine thioamidation protein, partial [Methanosarcinales archaeon]|nr:TfuA-related McrA-glycine thioamidation protein [Methanosarcinales archaeon]
AFELADFGMMGIGDIYQWFKKGDLIADDELAVTYDPQTLQPLSEPLVNIRETFKAAMSRDVLTEEEYSRLLGVAVAIFYPERTYKNIMNSVEEQDILSTRTLGELRSFIMHSAVDVKRADAVRVIKKVAEMCM